MIRQLSRALSGLALSVLVIYFTLRIFAGHHGGVHTFQARFEALVLGISMAMLAALVSSIVHLKLKRKLETTRIEEWVIGFASFGSEVDDYIGEVLASTYVFGFGELVRVVPSARGVLPIEFTWRGRRHHVQSIEGYRTENKRRQTGVIQRRFYHLRTRSGMRCLLSQDVAHDIWHLEHVLISRGGER